MSVRAAGFAANRVLALACPDAAAAVDRVTEHAATLAAASAAAERALHELARGRDHRARKPYDRALRQIRAGNLPDHAPELDACAGELAQLRAAHAAVAAARLAADTAMQDASARLDGELRALAGEPRFREAVLWQNRAAVASALDRVRDGTPARPTKQREHELLLARYLQRYCTKNDTIGFFGPLGWATFEDDDARAALEPGPSLLAQRVVTFEQWAIHALALELSRDPSVRERLCPRRAPMFRLVDGGLRGRGDQAVALPPMVHAILAACDGTTPAAALASALAARPELDLPSRDAVYDVLEELAARELVIWELELPCVPHADLLLREQLAALGRAGEPGLAALDRLEAARVRVTHAAGEPARLGDALAELDTTFSELAATDATRRAGQTYAARTVVFEDCRRDLALRFGPTFVRRIARPLGLVLQSARWYTGELAARFERCLDTVYGELRAETGSATIDYGRFYDRLLAVRTETLGAEVTRELVARWTEILAVDASARRVAYRADELDARVRSRFAAAHPGWAGARCQELDLMIAARSFDEVMQDGLVVLGELHVGVSNALRPTFVRMCPFAEELVAAHEHDASGPGVCLVLPRTAVTRGTTIWSPRDGYDVEIGTTISARPRDRVVAAADLVVEVDHDRLWARTHDGRVRFPLLAMFEYQLLALASFRILAQGSHVPRVTIDDVVVQREQWLVDGAQLKFDGIARSTEQFRAVRAWANSLGVPRHAFVKVDTEVKPFFVDFESPIYVDSFVRLTRERRQVVISEMLPAIEDAWLHDREGGRYTCELRMTAVDPCRWPDGAGSS